MRWGVLFVASLALAHAGVVRKDPVTGKWMSVDDSSLSDPRFRDRRVGGGDSGGFGGFGFDFFDSRDEAPARSSDSPFSAVKEITQPSTPQAEKVQSQVVDAVSVKDRPSRHSKYTADLPLQANVQTSSTSSRGVRVVPSSDFSDPIPKVVHLADEVNEIQTGVANALTTKTLGDVCRFKGVAPAAGCPVEARDGCVDREPCNRPCPNGGYFHWRCKGPQTFTQAQLTALDQVQPAPPSYEVRDPDEYIRELGNKVREAMQKNDYQAIARIIVETQMAVRSGRTSSAAAANLLQMAMLAQSDASASVEQQE